MLVCYIYYINRFTEGILYMHIDQGFSNYGSQPAGGSRNPPKLVAETLLLLFGTVDAYRPMGRGFESRCSRHVRTMSKSFAGSCLWRFGEKLRHSIPAVSGASLRSSGLEESL